jgi:hypothetical protein
VRTIVIDMRCAVKQRVRSTSGDDANPGSDKPGEFDPSSLKPETPGSLSPACDAEEVDHKAFRTSKSTVRLADVGVLATSVSPIRALVQGRSPRGRAQWLGEPVVPAHMDWIDWRVSSGSKDDTGKQLEPHKGIRHRGTAP